MKHILVIALIVALSLLLLGCGDHPEEQVVETPTTQAPLAEAEQDEEVALPTLELDLYTGGFEPTTLRATKGQQVVVTNYLEDDVHFSLAGLAVEEPLSQGGHVVFMASRAGSFEFTCQACEPAYFGTLVVAE